MTQDHNGRVAELRASYAALDRLTRNPRRFTPSAPWIIPATMVVVCAFALICLAVKLIMNYLNSKNQKSKSFSSPHSDSPDIPTTPDQDQASMATTASMKTRGGSLRLHRQLKSRPPPVSLYQMKQKQSPGSSVKSKSHRAAMKAMSRAARAEANRSRDSSRQPDDGSDDNSNNLADNSPNLSLDDGDDLQAGNQTSGLVYGATSARPDEVDGLDLAAGQSSNQPEVHIVQIRDLEEANLQHSQPTWSKTESDI